MSTYRVLVHLNVPVTASSAEEAEHIAGLQIPPALRGFIALLESVSSTDCCGICGTTDPAARLRGPWAFDDDREEVDLICEACMHVQQPIGVPYAPVKITADGVRRICPVCGEIFDETTDDTGELTSNNYGEHYASFAR